MHTVWVLLALLCGQVHEALVPPKSAVEWLEENHLEKFGSILVQEGLLEADSSGDDLYRMTEDDLAALPTLNKVWVARFKRAIAKRKKECETFAQAEASKAQQAALRSALGLSADASAAECAQVCGAAAPLLPRH